MSEGGPRYVKTGEGELPEVPYKHLVGSGDPDPKLRRAIEGKGLPAMEAFEKMVEMFVAAYRAGKPAVIEGATGSGKSMLTPLAIQEACRRLGISDRVVISQPRRDATQGVAEGVAALKREPVGKGVGWMTAERKCASEETDVIVMTTGVAKRWFFEGELTKEKVGAVMIDEVHECSVDVEMMTGSITRMFEKGVAPLVVLVSATLNRKEIEKHFALGEDQHVKVEGRSYPIETTYNPNNIPAPKEEKRAYLDQAADVVMQLCGNKSGARDEENEVSWVPKNTAGDILVFLPGAREIRDVEERVARSLVANDIRGFELCMYYGGLEQGERIRVMEMLQQKSEKRRIIIATNAAETSITFPHVETVVDTGVRRTARYDTHTGTTIQETTTISQDEANQRAGRAGRVAPGACIRLFSEEQFTAFPKHIEPEINRVNLANELLLLRSYGEDPETFPFMHPPQKEDVRSGIEALKRYGALDEEGNLTDTGKEMVKFTFDVPVARMVVEGKRRNVFAESFVLAALLREAGISGGDMFTRLPREGTERLQKEARRREIYDGDSDVLLLLSVFAEAIDRGLLHSRGEHSQRQSPEEWQRGESFWGWCKDAGIRGPSLVHAKHTIFRMLEEYNRKQKSDDKVSLDKDYLSEQLRMLVKNPEIIGEIITATYEHDILYASDTYGHLPDYSYVHQIKDSRGYSVLVNMSPGSRAFHAKPMVTVNIGGVKTGPGKGRRGVPITRNYANMNHTPSLIELRRAVPHLLEETIGERGYDQGKGRVYKTKVYTLKKSGQRIGTEKEVLLGKDAIPGIANALAQRSVQGFPYADENMQALEALRQFARKTGGAVQVPEMNEWYEKQLQDAPEDDPYAVLENTPDLLRLTIEEFVLKEEQEKYNEVYPDVVTIAGNECRVEYTYNPRSTYAEEQYVARVQIPSAEALFATPEEYSVVFGEDENTPRVTYMLASKGRRFEEESVAVLQEKVDAVRIQHEWEMWSSQKEKKILSYEDVREGVPMPGVFGINTEAYATTQKGTPVYAYPAIDAFEIAGDGDEREWRFTVAYYKSEDEARVAQEGAVAARKEFLQEAKRRKDVAEQLPALRERADSLAERVEYFFHKYDSIGIPYEEIRLLESDWNDVRYGIEGKELRDTYVRNAVIQPSSIQAALQQVDERLDAFAGYAETFEEKKRQLKEYFEKNKEKMKPLLDARYYTGSWARHGFFSRDDFNDCVGAWDVVSRASNTVGAAGLTIADIDDAILNAEKVETLLSQSDFEIWNTPVAQAYLEQKETKNRGIYARIRVSEGGVSLLEDGVFVNTNSFIVGQSGRNARVVSKSSNGGVVLQGYYSSGNTMTGNVVLPNGDYDIFRDMDHVFEVERDETEAETVRKVVREVSVYGGYEDDGEGDMTYSSNTRASFSAPEVSTDTRGSVLADAILAAQQDKKPKTKNTQQEIKDQSPRNDRHVESLITEEWKKEREAEMYALEGVLSILSRFLKRFAPNETMLERDATKREKSIEKLRRRLPEERHSLTEIIKRLSETTKGESSTSVSGGIETVRRSVQALVKDADRNMRGGDGSWFDSVLEAYTGVDAAITDSADAQEYIEGGLVVSSDVRQKVFEYLSNEVSETLEHVSYDEYIQRALNELTE